MEEPIEEIEQTAEVQETEVEAEVKEEAATSAEEHSDEESRNDTETKPKGVQKRIDTLTRQKYSEQRRAELAESELERLKTAQPEQPAGKPVLDDFETLEEHQDALMDWKLDRRDADSRQADSLRTQADTAATMQATVESSTQFLIGEGNAKHADFQAVAGTIPPSVMNNDMLIALAESEYGADIAYHLGNNPAEAAAMQDLSPVQIGRALAKLENLLEAKESVVTTKAPEPIKPSGSTAAASKDPAKMSDKEFAAHRRKQIGKRSKFAI